MSEPVVTITCKYSCPLCGLKRVEVKIPARLSPEEPVDKWMKELIRLLGADHGQRSPMCFPKELKEVLIPADGGNWVGAPRTQ